MRYRIGACFLTVLFTALPSGAAERSAPRSHLDLDWQAPSLWVHVDNLDARKASIFESARRQWLDALRRDGGLLGDGRALFWQARSSPAGQTLFSFYPFRDWAELDARRTMVEETQRTVGKAAVEAYDAGDVALVSPHYTQIWRRAPDYDIASESVKDLTEAKAGAGRLEVHEMDLTRGDELDAAWKRMAETLVAVGYPMACRVFTSSYGRGETMVWWMARDPAAFRAAPSLRAALDAKLGRKESAKLLRTLDRIFPTKQAYEIERRPDLSNLGK